MGRVELKRGMENFKQGFACIEEQLQPLHGLCSRTVVHDIFKLFNFSTPPPSILAPSKIIGDLIISSPPLSDSPTIVIGIC